MNYSIILFLSVFVMGNAQAENWQCSNDLEITCLAGKCTAETEGSFTPMQVHIEESGTISVCAYSGCWEGLGKIHKSEDFLMITAHKLAFSSAQGTANIALTIDLHDHVAILKVGAFAHPLLCKPQKNR